MRFQYISNICLELKNGIPFHKLIYPGKAPILCLVGGIGSPYSTATRKFLEWCSNEWDNVLWVPGHREFSHMDRTKADAHIQFNKLCSSIPRIHGMNNRTWKLNSTDNYVFIGSSLISLQHTTELPQAVRWLDSHIDEAKELNEKAICLTYIPPITGCIYKDNKNAHMNYPDLIRNPVCTWIIGDLTESIHISAVYRNKNQTNVCNILSNCLNNNTDSYSNNCTVLC